MKLNQKSKVLIYSICFVLLFALVIVITDYLPKLKQEKEQPQETSVSQPIPEADIADTPDGKTDSYLRSGIADYWDSLEEHGSDQEEESVLDEPSLSSSGRGGRRPRSMSVEDMFGDVSQSAPAQSEPKAPAMKAPEPSPKEDTGDSQPSSRVQVKKSGAISSLDDDVIMELGSGISTLDGTDMWVQGESGKAYRCMFTRDEKVKTGQRISLRLLEDLVIGGVHVPQNTHLQGVCTIADRMEISITSLDMGGRILSFHFEVYDTDGGKGIYCSDISKTKDAVTNQGISTALNGLNSRIGSAARDAAALGASIVRSKSGEVTVSVPAGYTFYIMEEKRW